MGMMKDLNQYLKRRGQRWHYVRRVPKEYEAFDKRGTVYKSLKTESLQLARAKRDALVQADNQYWLSVVASGEVSPEVALEVFGTPAKIWSFQKNISLILCANAHKSLVL